MEIGGRVILVDTNRFDVRGDQEAVLIGNDGELTIGCATLHSDPQWRGAKRYGLTPWRRAKASDNLPRGATRIQTGVTILGAVIAG